ncbi:MAG TPA: hypothetical protein H9675_00445 [Firmicutes bacterium]|nr:hypothetical protein [Bacillota bacterium]
MIKSSKNVPSIAAIADDYGIHSINIFGDSISHGAGAPIIYEESYAAIVRNSINHLYSGVNYGYASMMSTLWPGGKLRCSEIHEIQLSQEAGGYSLGHDDKHWSRDVHGKHIGGCAMYSDVVGANLMVRLAKEFNYMCIYYLSGSDKGTFDIYDDNGIMLSVDAYGNTPSEKRTAFIDISGRGVASPFFIKNTTADADKNIYITGIAYYNDPESFTLNNYSLGGRCFHYQEPHVLKEACQTSTLIFGLGYNDATFAPNQTELFAQKADIVINEVNKNHTSLYVLDYVWNYPEDNFFKKELRRIVSQTNGRLIDMTADMNGRKDLFVDDAHPTVDGHRMIAEKLLKAMNIPVFM